MYATIDKPKVATYLRRSPPTIVECEATLAFPTHTRRLKTEATDWEQRKEKADSSGGRLERRVGLELSVRLERGWGLSGERHSSGRWTRAKSVTRAGGEARAGSSSMLCSSGGRLEQKSTRAGLAQAGLARAAQVEIRCRKVDLTCNGIDWCQFPDRSHFAGCERYEADEEEMRKLWNHELDQNEVEAASHIGIIARFYTRVRNAKCKVSCDGVPILVRYTQNASAYGKEHFIGCSKWNPGERGNHIYFAIPANLPERDVRYVVENDGNLPPGHDLPDTKCVLTVHPRVKLQNCPYSHIINNQIVPAKMERRGCDSKLIIFVPINFSPDTAHKAIILLKKPHNHPMHPPSKPSASDQLKLRTAVAETGVLGLTVQKFLNAPSTSKIYGGHRVAEISPAYTDTRKIRDALAAEKVFFNTPRLEKHRSDYKESIVELRREIDEEKDLRRKSTLRQKEIDAKRTELRKGGLAGVRINGRRPNARPDEDPASEPEAGAVWPGSGNDAVSSGFHGVGSDQEHNLPDWRLGLDNNEDAHLDERASSFPGSSSEPESLINEACAVDQGNMQVGNNYHSSLYPASQNTQYTDHTGTGNTTIFNANSVAFAHQQMPEDSSGQYFSSGIELYNGEFNYAQFDVIMANIDGYVPPDSRQEGTPNTTIDESSQGIEYLDDNLHAGESSVWRASQELPPIPQPRSDTPEYSVEFPDITEESETADFEEPFAAQNIDLELDERNILTGKRARTKSTRAKDLERASKRRT
ncbi:hypothetical protein R3P38DRAFT_2771217 [Favolaschia claudopus]|uniref:Uncharacterized protein n=1 Tax=Favolaschia claudopus TaxID=2862362 RepID=A0AAW0CAH9_9AGAR